MELSKTNKELIKAYELGYRVVNGIIYNPDGNILTGCEHNGYQAFQAFKFGRKIRVHRLVAYQKYGNDIFKEGIQVRHLDGNKQNNSDENIRIGTAHENAMDKPKHVRHRQSIIAARKVRKFTDEEINQIRTDYLNTRSYKLVMEKWNISSKGTLHYIINNNYVT